MLKALDAATMDDREFAVGERERIERSASKRLAPGRRPGGPRQAFRPIQNLHLRAESSAPADSPADADEIYPAQLNRDLAEMDIDPSCLDALDDQLLSSPIDSFADVCWADAVEEHDSESDRDSPTLYNAPISTVRCNGLETCHNDYHDLDPLAPEKGKWYADADEDESDNANGPYETEPMKRTNLFSSHLPGKGNEHLLSLWEPHFTMRNPNDTIHAFPSRPHKSRRWRKFDVLANACAHLPGCLIKSTT